MTGTLAGVTGTLDGVTGTQDGVSGPNMDPILGAGNAGLGYSTQIGVHLALVTRQASSRLHRVIQVSSPRSLFGG